MSSEGHSSKPRLRYKKPVALFAFSIFIAASFCLLQWPLRMPIPRQKWDVSNRKTTNPRPVLEIRMHGGAFGPEGIGGVLSALRGILVIAKATGAVMTLAGNKYSTHSYPLRKYLRIGFPVPGRRRMCNFTSAQVDEFARTARLQCDRYNHTVARNYFRDCDTLNVKYVLGLRLCTAKTNLVLRRKPLGHPKTCTAYTAPLVRAMWIPELPSPWRRRDVCVLRRGGDLEHKLHTPYGLRYRIDLERTLPVLEAARKARKRTVLITQTKKPAKLQRLYQSEVLSNNEQLDVVMWRLALCRCLFVAQGSSFAMAVAQIAQPELMIYTQPREGWNFTHPFQVSDLGDRTMPVTVPIYKMIQRCVYS